MKAYQLGTAQLPVGNTYTKQTFQDIMGWAPTMGSKIFQLWPQWSTQYYLQGLRGVYQVNKTPELINKPYYEWELMGNTDYSEMIVQDVAGVDLGKSFQPFKICLKSDYFYKQDIIMGNGKQQYIVLDRTEIGIDKWEYTVVISSNNPLEVADLANLKAGQYLAYAGNAQGELSNDGAIKNRKTKEKHIEYLSTIRHQFSISGHANSTQWYIEDTDKNGRKAGFVMSKLEYEAMQNLAYSKEQAIIFGRSNVLPNGQCTNRLPDGTPLWRGNGIIEQIDASSKENYTSLTKQMLQDILSEMESRSGQEAMDITLITGTKGFQQWQNLMESLLKPGDNTYTTRSGNKVTLGANFTKYIYGTHSITVTKTKLFDHKDFPSELDTDGSKLSSSDMLFLDTGSIEGSPNIQLISRPGRELIMNTIAGVGGMDGKTSGPVSSVVDGAMKVLLAEIGVVMKNPYSSFYLTKKSV